MAATERGFNMIDASIALGVKPPQFDSPMNALAKVLQIKQAQQGQQMDALKMEDYQIGRDRTNRLQTLLTGDYTDPQARQDAMLKGGFLKEATDYGKSNADVTKATTENQAAQLKMAHDKIDLMGQAFGFVKDNPSSESAIQATDYLVQNGIMTAEQAQATKAKIAADPSPETIRSLATQAWQNALSTKDQLPKLQTINVGNAQVSQSVNPITGQATETGRMPINQSADSIASNATSRVNNSANIAAQDKRASANLGYGAGMSPEQVTALDQAVSNGLDPYKINSRTGPIYARLEIEKPGRKWNDLGAAASFDRNAGVMNTKALLNTIDPLLEQLIVEGKKMTDTGSPLVNSPLHAAQKYLLPDAMGGAAVTGFDNLRDDTIAEVERGLMGTGVLSDSKYQRALKNLNSAQTVLQRKQAVDNIRFVIKTRLESLANGPNGGAGKPTAPTAGAKFLGFE